VLGGCEGRRAGIASATSLWLGIDIGGTKTALAVGDGQGALLARCRHPTRATPDAHEDLRQLALEARALVQEAGLGLSAIRAVGVSVAGPLDVERGVVLNPPNLPWRQAPVREVLALELGRPVHVENDANAAALAEWRFGAGRGSRDMLYLTMSTGIGGGLVLGGRLHRGVACSAGEVGHVPVVWEGEPCACGMRGCLEAYIGGASWRRRLARRTPAHSLVATLAGGPEEARPEHVVQAAREGDAFALAEMARFNDYLARAIVQLGFTLAPERIVLGTIAAAAGEALCLAPVRARVASHLWSIIGEGLEIVPAALGERQPDYAGLGVAIQGEQSDGAGPAGGVRA